MNIAQYQELRDSDVTWIGPIPKEWRIVKIKVVATIRTGSTPSGNDGINLDSLGYSWFTPSDSNPSLILNCAKKFISSDSVKKYKISLFLPESILFVGIGKIGLVGMTGDLSYSNQQITAIQPHGIYPKFLLYTMIITSRALGRIAPNTMLPIVNNGLLANTHIPLPNSATQKKIADFLDAETAKIDNLIAKQERLLELLEEKRRATITHAVTRGLDPNVELKETKIPWLGKIPAHWQSVRAARLFVENKENNTDLESLEPMKYRFGEIVPKLIDVDENSKEELRRYLLIRPQDLMINGLNLNYDFVTQRVAIVKSSGCMTPAYISIRKRNDEVVPEYYKYLLKGLDGQKVLNGWGTGIRLTLNYSEFKKKELTKPPTDEQLEIVDYLDQYTARSDDLKQKIQTQITLLRERRTSLISHAVTGKIKV